MEMVHSHAALVSDLIRAMHQHGQILSKQRETDFSLLMDAPQPGLSIVEILQEIADLRGKRIEGFVETTSGVSLSTWSVLLRALNILACFVWRGLECANSFADVRPTARLDTCLQLLGALLEADHRWRVITPEHAERIAVQVGQFVRRTNNPYTVDVDAVREWARQRAG